ncbi:PilZ domain-containing protein [Methylobacterium gnaphalii]|uniref:PilZ domain-containing protein n=1 Tax=Methylobacterium gnaphalii TaxID=1010610 RepID=A0A512JNY4_9HYPH|nr:PilZ domain-containing protein [Methylobacterium gnaphalii]GEP11648.1 hypothetical protein MGN01_34930 [Methylobacterium gnaphalii]GJD69551.1 hypothetical protein MMMDOFMJ_2488 [Methylobacterium gnaphalii]GLS49089.1 hypothetical protein GCM10007885_19370 [Methylobacterium gnaphalii]
MIERRKRPRVRADSVAFIFTKTGNPVACRMIDRSPDGARLLVDSVFGIPDKFRLVVQKSGESFSTQVVWRGPQELGVAFGETPDVLAVASYVAAPEPIDIVLDRTIGGLPPDHQSDSLTSGVTPDL